MILSYLFRKLIELQPTTKNFLIVQLMQFLDSCDQGTAENILWIIGEYAKSSPKLIEDTISKLSEFIGFSSSSTDKTLNTINDLPNVTNDSKISQKVLPDGTYSIASKMDGNSSHNSSRMPLKFHLFSGNYSIITSLSLALTKLVLQYCKFDDSTLKKKDKLRAKAIFLISSMLRTSLSKLVKHKIQKDDYEFITFLIRLLINPNEGKYQQVILEQCHSKFIEILKRDLREGELFNNGNHNFQSNGIDDEIKFYQFEDEIKFQNRPKATFQIQNHNEYYDSYISNLDNIHQLTGLSDPIYAETIVKISNGHIFLDILLINQTKETLTNCNFDLATNGELRLVTKPDIINIAPEGFSTLKAVFKVTATDNGQIFGCLSFGNLDIQSVIMEEIKIDVSRYIEQAIIELSLFRENWILLEWENKISIQLDRKNGHLLSLKEFMQRITNELHFSCLNRNYGISSDGRFLSALIYAKSIFDEEIMANVSLEHNSNSINGNIRLRSKSQGIVTALGNKIEGFCKELQKVAFKN